MAAFPGMPFEKQEKYNRLKFNIQLIKPFCVPVRRAPAGYGMMTCLKGNLALRQEGLCCFLCDAGSGREPKRERWLMGKKDRIPILYEDGQLMVCEKPAGIPVQSDKTRDPDVITLLKNRIFEREGALEEPYLTAVHRLDRPVGGLMVLARSKAAAASLSEQVQTGLFEKNYQAVCCGRLEEEFGSMEDYLIRDGRKNMTSVVKKGTKGARYACLDYEMIDCIETKKGPLTWVLVSLGTGRHHQIRVQFASRGLPLYGDTRYNPAFRDAKKKYYQIGLYATRLAFLHPETGEKMVFKTEPKGEAFELMDVEAF